MFRYNSLEWHSPYYTRGPATAGVNVPPYGFNVTDDPNDIIDFQLVSLSNVGEPGLFVYQLD